MTTKINVAGKPTLSTYDEWQTAFDFFNAVIFDAELPEVIITLDNKGKRILGYFHAERYINTNGELTDCLSMNPTCIKDRPLIIVFATLVHEMCHIWDYHTNGGSNRAYHSAVWADKMESIGLMPSNTGEPGGKRTGQKMCHYIIDGGLFEEMATRFIETNYGISWADRTIELDEPDEKPEKKKVKSKNKYTCPGCGANVWGKPDLQVACLECQELFVMEDPE
jgi:predicted SprT family Zn-dependent metalloprotease